MKTDSLDRRLADLEKQQEEPPKIRLRGFDEPNEPPKPGTTRVKLRWLDEDRL